LFLLLAALYTFTIYLKGFMSVLDTAFLLLLFGGYVWRVWCRGAAPLTRMAGSGPNAVGTGTLALAAVLAVVVILPLAGILASGTRSLVADDISLIRWLPALGSKAPLIIVLAILVWTARTGEATSTLICSQLAQLTLLLGSMPLAFSLHGLILGNGGGSLALGDRQQAEVLLIASQTLFIGLLLAGMTVSPRRALALLGLFSLQVVLSVVHLAEQSTLAHALPAAVYLGASVTLITRDRDRLRALFDLAPPSVAVVKRPKAGRNVSGLG
jgi:cation:H+ antiporter